MKAGLACFIAAARASGDTASVASRWRQVSAHVRKAPGSSNNASHVGVGGRVGGGRAQATEEQGVVDVVLREPSEQIVREGAIVDWASSRASPSFARRTRRCAASKRAEKRSSRSVARRTASSSIVGDERQQRLGEASQVPLRDARLIGECVASAVIDRAELLLRDRTRRGTRTVRSRGSRRRSPCCRCS